MKPVVTIVVPVYNGKELLPTCLDSIRAQTFADFECILVDDGSTDGSGQLCDELAARDPRFRVLHQTNGGVCSARNAGILAAAGEYVVFCDQDDQLAPQTLDWALTQQKLYPEYLIAWPYTRELTAFHDQPKECSVSCFGRDQMLLYFSGDMFIYIWNKLFPRELLTKMPALFCAGLVGGGEDFDFMARFMPLFYRAHPSGGIAQICAPLYFWNLENPGSVSKWSSNYRGYSLKQLTFFKNVKSAFEPFYEQEDRQIALCFNRLLRPMVFGFGMAKKNGESLAEFWHSPELEEMLQWMKNHRWYLGFYGPLRLHCAPLARLMLRWMDEKPALYGKLYWLFYYLFACGWEHI